MALIPSGELSCEHGWYLLHYTSVNMECSGAFFPLLEYLTMDPVGVRDRMKPDLGWVQ